MVKLKMQVQTQKNHSAHDLKKEEIEDSSMYSRIKDFGIWKLKTCKESSEDLKNRRLDRIRITNICIDSK